MNAKIVIPLQGKMLELSPEEARELLDALKSVMGEERVIPYPVYPTYPQYPFYHSNPVWQVPTLPTITCGASLS